MPCLPTRRAPLSPPTFVHAARAGAMLGLIACGLPSFAQQPPGPGGHEGSSWGVGLAVGGVQQAYKGMDRTTRGLPLLSFENRYLKLSGPNLEVKLPGLDLSPTQSLNVGLVAKLFGGPSYKASDSPALAGMAERKSSVWAGAKVEWENSLADIKLEWLADASGHSKGQRVVLGAERKWMLNRNVMLVPQINVEWVDRKYVDYHYGVRADEASAGRAAYTGQATVNTEISLSSIYRFDRHHSAMLNVGVKALGTKIKNSPIVGRSSENRVMLGYLYRF